ncbi:MAG TPA: hypothetical protein VNY83_02390 [Solirubrobacterales bacterium]|jgi:hypothetical protein|nr:hypothetical protein [Solirubrobacterales bacterium]
MQSRGGSLASRLRWVSAFALLLCIASLAAPVLARSDSEASPIGEEVSTHSESSPHGPNNEEVVALLQAAKRKEEDREEHLASPAAVEERKASQHAYADLNATEAEELLSAKFPEALAALNADPARYLSDTKVDRPLGEGRPS